MSVYRLYPFVCFSCSKKEEYKLEECAGKRRTIALNNLDGEARNLQGKVQPRIGHEGSEGE